MFIFTHWISVRHSHKNYESPLLSQSSFFTHTIFPQFHPQASLSIFIFFPSFSSHAASFPIDDEKNILINYPQVSKNTQKKKIKKIRMKIKAKKCIVVAKDCTMHIQTFQHTAITNKSKNEYSLAGSCTLPFTNFKKKPEKILYSIFGVYGLNKKK